MKKVVIVLAVSFLLLGLLAGLVVGSLFWQWNLPLAGIEERTFEIQRGNSVRTIGIRLAEEGFINHHRTFEFLVRLGGQANQIKAGKYLIEPGMDLRDLLSKMVSGQSIPDDVTVRILEGLTVTEASLAFEESGLMSAQDFETAAVMRQEYGDFAFLRDVPFGENLIGYLFPDTYRFRPDTTPEQAVRRILENTQRRFISLGINDPDTKLGRMENLHQILTFASIVQKETPQGDEHLIAGVFFNRLQNGWRFESDATVNFILNTSKLIPTGQDIRTQHPYNTYLIRGLPPGPINSPGTDAIRATLNPAKHDYFFFLHTPDRVTKLSRTFEEHLRFRAQYWE